MKAFVRTSASNMEVIVQDVPIPEIKSDEVLIQVKAFGVGIYDRYFIPGGMGFGENPNFPYVIWSEGSGIVVKKWNNVSNFTIDDKVIFTTVLQEQGWSWAEFAVAKESTLIKLPANLSYEQGAALPIAGKTALDAFKALHITEGNTLFVAGASGAIGTLIIQMAKMKGAKIAASASEKNHEYMKSLWADKTVDYHDSDWKNEVKSWSNGGVDMALAIQPQTVHDSMEVVKDGWRVITVSGDDQTLPERGISIQQFQHSMDSSPMMKQFVSDVADWTMTVTLQKVYSFEEALLALEKTETRHARWKLVVKV